MTGLIAGCYNLMVPEYILFYKVRYIRQVSEKRDQVFYVVVIEVFYVDYFQFSIIGKSQIHFIGFSLSLLSF